MTIYTEKELEEVCPLAIMIGTEQERSKYNPAIIGIAKDNSHIAYSFEKLVSCFMRANNWSWEEAVEWIDTNVEPALPYYGEHAPVVLSNNFVSSRNRTYVPVKIKED
jgi:hypothetical protein